MSGNTHQRWGGVMASGKRLVLGAMPMILLLFGGTRSIAGEQEPSERLAPFVIEHLDRYCIRCHGSEIQESDRRLDDFPVGLATHVESIELLEEVLDAINRGEMPPEEPGRARPPVGETRRVVDWLTKFLASASEGSTASTTTMRRLNRFEYTNTLRDLIGLKTKSFDRFSDFPVDATRDGFDNNGEALVLSDHQLQRYVEAAQSSLEEVAYFDVPKPKRQTWRYSGGDFNGVTSYQRAPVTWRLIVDDEILEIGHGQPSERHANFVKDFVKQGGAPADGYYTIRVRAAAANRLDHGYEHEEFERFKTFPLKMALWVAPEARFLEKNAADQRRLLRVWDLPDTSPEEFTHRVWLQQGAIPFVSWTNGVSSKGNIRRVAEKHHPEVIRATNTQLDSAKLGNLDDRALVARLMKNEENPLLSEVYRGPRIRVWNMEIDGPDYDSWPPKSHRLLFGAETDPDKINIDLTINRFAARAFRRPVERRETQHYADYVRQRIMNGDSPDTAIRLGMTGILASPRFLFLDEGDDDSGRRLEPFELASRLSYFLWSTMPDEALLEAAESGTLTNPETLSDQVERMLSDRRMEDFVEHFTDGWLHLSKLGEMPPDLKSFGHYYADRLEPLFKKETRLFFEDLIRSNGAIVQLLDSDYTFVNDALAKHYQMERVTGEHFRRVALRAEHRRGGLLGQGSVLTLTANGIETSPVVRGVWVLENLLGTPPSPPPPDVEPLEPDTRGTTTIREQLERHRDVATCAACHQKIDPIGFALEFYDPVGGFRTRYPARGKAGSEVDGSGQLVTGESFVDERGLKRLLVERKEEFAETLVEKLLTHATGRSMTFRDREEIKQVARRSGENGHGLRDLIVAVVQSQIFQNR
ncbi:MAG: DUF1592 domain-containing protein [Planctomycetota bacterium]